MPKISLSFTVGLIFLAVFTCQPAMADQLYISNSSNISNITYNKETDVAAFKFPYSYVVNVPYCSASGTATKTADSYVIAYVDTNDNFLSNLGYVTGSSSWSVTEFSFSFSTLNLKRDTNYRVRVFPRYNVCVNAQSQLSAFTFYIKKENNFGWLIPINALLLN